jgi:hypothetical protein
MELYINKLATVINPFKKFQEPGIIKEEEHEFTLFSNLPTELRLKIWAFCYLLPQPPRIVEVRTQKHDNCPHHEGFCPRYSPTRKHPLINTTHEARSVTHFEALKTGHLIFSSPSTGIIIFNPAHDLLYLPAEPHPLPLTRGPKGTYTQYKKSHSPLSHPSPNWNHNYHISPSSALRFLAIDLERYGSQFNPMRLAIHDFPALEDLVFVAPD